MAEVLTLQEVARYLKLSPDTIYRRAKRGEMPAVRVGKLWRFPKDLIDKWLRERAKATKGRRKSKPSSGKLDPKKDPLLKLIGSINHGSLAEDIDKELYGD